MPLRPALLAEVTAIAALISPIAFAAVPEARIPTTATQLEEVNRPFGSQYEWVDTQRLVVPGIRMGDGWDASVYLIDLSSAGPQKLMDDANVFCTVADQRLFNVLRGKIDGDRLDRLVMIESKLPQMHHWDARQRKLLPAKAVNAQSPASCVTPEQFDTFANERPFKSIPLPQWSAQLRISYDGMNPDGIFLERPGTGKPSVRLGLPPISPQVPAVPYLAFVDEYLLSPGMLVKKPAPGGSRSQETAGESPLLTLTRQGALKKSTFEGYFKRLNAPAPEYVALPYARGTLLMASGWRNEGAGMYTVAQGKLSRVWCNNLDNSTDSPKCDIENAKLSPDGCAVAFYSSTTFDSQGRPDQQHRRELIVLPLCEKAQTKPRPKP